MTFLVSLRILSIFSFPWFLNVFFFSHLLVISFNILPFSRYARVCLRDRGTLQVFFFLLHVLLENRKHSTLSFLLEYETNILSETSPWRFCTLWELLEWRCFGLFLHLCWISRVQWENFVCMFTFDIFRLYRTVNLHWDTESFAFFKTFRCLE